MTKINEMNRFKNLRKKLGLYQKDMASKFDLKTRHYQNLEYGYKPRPHILRRLKELEKNLKKPKRGDK